MDKTNDTNSANNASNTGKVGNISNTTKPTEPVKVTSTESVVDSGGSNNTNNAIIGIIILVLLVSAGFYFNRNKEGKTSDDTPAVEENGQTGIVEGDSSTNDQAFNPGMIIQPAPSDAPAQNNSPVSYQYIEKRITDGDARVISLVAVPGRIADLSQEMRLGIETYKVKVRTNAGELWDIAVNLKNGKILAIEKSS